MSWPLLLVLAAATQQAWPSHARELPRPAPVTVAVVNGVPLLSDRLEAAVNTLLPTQSFHQNVNAAKLADLRRQALMQIVDEELQFQDGVRGGLRVADREVEAALADAMARYPSRKAFTTALAQSGATMTDMRRELRRRLTIARALDLNVTSRCAVDRDEAQRYFAQHPERFVEPERLRIHAITIGVEPSGGTAAWAAARTRADEVRRQLADGADFESLATRYSTDTATAAKGGDMGLVHRGSLSQAFEAVAAALRVGETSAIVETIYGYHLIRVTEILPPRPRSFADVGERLQQDLSAERCTSAKDAWLASLRATATIAYPR
jgi:peptidyl-prolyl cis-trans isomerase C